MAMGFRGMVPRETWVRRPEGKARGATLEVC